jgi:hypothetical protein
LIKLIDTYLEIGKQFFKNNMEVGLNIYRLMISEGIQLCLSNNITMQNAGITFLLHLCGKFKK